MYGMVDLHSTDIQTKLKDIDDYIRQESISTFRTGAPMNSSSPGGYTQYAQP